MARKTLGEVRSRAWPDGWFSAGAAAAAAALRNDNYDQSDRLTFSNLSSRQ